MSTDVVILSMPHTEEGYFAVAPILLSACLNESGISAKGLDFASEFRLHFSGSKNESDVHNWLRFGHLGLQLKDFKPVIAYADKYIREIIQPMSPKYVGLSVFTSHSLNYTNIMVGRLRKVLPQVKIVLGGRGLDNIDSRTNLPIYQLLNQAKVADLIIVGDAEFSLVESIKLGKTGIVHSKELDNKDLSLIPIPDWKDSIEIINKTGIKHATVTASKGCVRNCTFCDVSSYWPHYAYRDGALVAEEIANIYHTTGISEVLFTDNLINGSISNFRKMNQRLIELFPVAKIKYGGYAIYRPKDTMPESDFALAAKAGCAYWSVGVESGSERIRNLMGKKFSNSDIKWCSDTMSKYGIVQRWLLMVGYPAETNDDFEKTLALVKEYAYLGKEGLLSISLTNPFMALENSPIFKHHTITASDHQWMQHFWTTPENPGNTFDVRVTRWQKLKTLITDLKIPWTRPAQQQSWELELYNLNKYFKEEYLHESSTIAYQKD